MVSISDFTSRYKNVARVNRFKLTGFGVNKDLEFFAKGAMLPATNIGTLDVPYQGRIAKYDGDRTYEDFTFTVMDNEDMELRKDFETWNNEYNSPEENVGAFEYREGYVELLKRDGGNSIKFHIINAVCLNVAQVDLAWDSNDQPLEFQVTLSYNWHEIV